MSGIGTTSRLILRRDRVLLPVWIVVLAGFVTSTASTFAKSYPTEAARESFASGIRGNPAMTAFYGALLDDSVGGLTAWRVGVAGALLFGIFSIVIMIRHTRREEESGRTELLNSGAIGRNAQLTAVLLVCFGAHLLIAILIVAGLAGQGLPIAGSVALAASLAVTGCAVAAAAATAAQLTTSARTATGIAAAFFALAMVLRMAGDAAGADGDPSWLLWLTPLGWSERLRPFAGEQWGVLLLGVALIAALVAVAYLLSSRRDIGSGLLPARPGPTTANSGLRGPVALAWRLHRGTLLATVLGFALIGLLMGSVADSVGGVVGTSPDFVTMLDRLHAANAGDAMMRLLVYALAEMIAIYAILIVLRLRNEESDGTAAPLLVAGVSRLRWAASHLLFAAVAPGVVLFALGLTAGLSYGLATGDAVVIFDMLGATLAKLPALWVLAGLATALFGLLPKAAIAISWAVLGLTLLIELGWELGAIGHGVFAVSPFAHVYPGDPVSPGSLLALTLIAVLLATAGMAGLRRRDFA
ncbi:ABC transporter permease [Nonomuraea helvata]|uniref:ABC transporter permease n=1 Tax=Nonomuraea helvata TaxID=37484 RepID=A0ABV5SE93_9ACTN